MPARTSRHRTCRDCGGAAPSTRTDQAWCATCDPQLPLPFPGQRDARGRFVRAGGAR
jgi:hypothetical protein